MYVAGEEEEGFALWGLGLIVFKAHRLVFKAHRLVLKAHRQGLGFTSPARRKKAAASSKRCCESSVHAFFTYVSVRGLEVYEP